MSIPNSLRILSLLPLAFCLLGSFIVGEPEPGGPYPDSKCINIDPDHATTDWLMWRAPVALTITGVDCIVDVATSVVLTPNECDGNGGSCSAIEAAITCGTTNTTEASGVDNASIDAGDYIRVTRGAKTGSPTQAVLCLEMTFDD